MLADIGEMGGDSSTSKSAITFVAGAVAGAISRTATAPLDRLKTMLQAGPSSGSSAMAVANAHCTTSALSLIYRQGGIAALFQGNTANSIKAMPEVGVKFLVFEQFSAGQGRSATHRRQAPTLSWHERLLPGAVAGVASTLVIYPLEIAKTRMALAPSPGYYSGVTECILTTIRHEGLGALSQGLGASLVGIVPFCALDLALYSALKERVQQHTADSAEPGTIALLGCGACSSAIAQVATYPLALIRTVMQAAGSPLPGAPPRYESMHEAIVQTVQLRGLRGLYHGLMPNMLKAVPSLSLSYVIFEQSKRWLGARS